MTGLPATTLATILGASHIAGPKERIATSVSTDTRNLTPGAIWFALKGENFDANHFTSAAALAGAAVAVVSAPPIGKTNDCVVLLVEDTLEALQRLAAWWRSRLSALRVVGITGSNGKTSTKDFTRSVLAQKFQTTATIGNFNNHIGVPLSILRANPIDEAAVWEMGMNHAGELEALCSLTRPVVGLISSIGSAHIEFLGSKLAIAEEKSTLLKHLPEDGLCVFPDDCEFGDVFRSVTKARVLTVGIERGDIQAKNIQTEENGVSFELILPGMQAIRVKLPVAGRHMVSNALLAAAAGWFYEISPEQIAHGLAEVELSGGRLQMKNFDGIGVLDDSYNANPDSMEAALKTLAEQSLLSPEGRRFAILGHMGELGAYSKEGHQRVGKFAATLGLDFILTQGVAARAIFQAASQSCSQVLHFENADETAQFLKSEAKPGDLILVKGSRSAAMEKVIQKAFLEK